MYDIPNNPPYSQFSTQFLPSPNLLWPHPPISQFFTNPLPAYYTPFKITLQGVYGLTIQIQCVEVLKPSQVQQLLSPLQLIITHRKHLKLRECVHGSQRFDAVVE